MTNRLTIPEFRPFCQELAKGGKVAALEKQLNAIDMEIAKLKTQADGKTKEIKEEEHKIKELERNAKEVGFFPSSFSELVPNSG